jgi:hypothetical protein
VTRLQKLISFETRVAQPPLLAGCPLAQQRGPEEVACFLKHGSSSQKVMLKGNTLSPMKTPFRRNGFYFLFF